MAQSDLSGATQSLVRYETPILVSTVPALKY